MTYFLRIAYDTGDMYIKTMSKDAVAKLLGEAGKPVSGLSNLGEPSIPEGEEGEVEEADEESRSGVASGGSGSAAREGSSSTAPSSSTSAGAQQQERVTLQLFGGNSQQGAGSSSAPTPAPTAANETGGGGSSRRALRGSWGMLDGGSGMSARRGLNSIIEDCPSCSGNGVCRCISGVDNRRQVGWHVAALLAEWCLRNRGVCWGPWWVVGGWLDLSGQQRRTNGGSTNCAICACGGGRGSPRAMPTQLCRNGQTGVRYCNAVLPAPPSSSVTDFGAAAVPANRRGPAAVQGPRRHAVQLLWVRHRQQEQDRADGRTL